MPKQKQLASLSLIFIISFYSSAGQVYERERVRQPQDYEGGESASLKGNLKGDRGWLADKFTDWPNVVY